MIEYVRVQNLKPGDISRYTLYDDEERVLLRGGKPLTEKSIHFIQEFGYKGIYIEHQEDRRELIPLPEPLFEDLLLIKLFTTVKSMFDNKKIIHDVFDPQFMADRKVLHELMEEIVDILIKADKENRLLFELEDNRSMNTWIYFHSVKVCLLSIGIAIKLGLSRKEIFEIALGAIYHDMGKARVSIQIANKKNLSDEERLLMREHPENMFRFLQKHNYSLNTLYAVWQHHEKINGGGYPQGLPQEKILLSARIVSCANVYDHLINQNPYGNEYMYAAEAIEYMCANKDQDMECLRAMLKVVVPYSVGTKIRLSDGSIALVVKNIANFPLRPTIIVNKKLVMLDVDSEYLNITIKEIVQ